MVKCEDCKKKIEERKESKSNDELFFERWSDKKQCMEAVKQNGYSLQYVKEQSEALCMEAVKQDGDSLQYVKEQSEALCMEAVKQNGYSLQYVKEHKIFIKIQEAREI